MKSKNIRYELYTFTPEQYHDVKQSILYENINFLLVPSLWEGGPVAIGEALASGVPIISSDVGYVPEFNVEHMFAAGDINQLIFILKDIENKIMLRRKKVENMSYTDFNKNLKNIFLQILKNKNG